MQRIVFSHETRFDGILPGGFREHPERAFRHSRRSSEPAFEEEGFSFSVRPLSAASTVGVALPLTRPNFARPAPPAIFPKFAGGEKRQETPMFPALQKHQNRNPMRGQI
jgi:hypothetical protein